MIARGMEAEPRPLGGPIFTPAVLGLAAFTVLALLLLAWRMAVGLGASTAMNDGYPWGLWIAFDVVTGTAFGCGGFAMALLVYIANRGQYHPLVRPALLTSALGYSIAGFSVLIDLGRPWLVWKVPVFFWHWNPNSVLLEVALCIMAYVAVLWIELLPAFLEKAATSTSERLRGFATRVLPPLRRSMVWVIALGMLLPTMHQSSLGSLLLLAGPRLHPLWNTPLLPLLFLISCIAMGYGAVVLEGSLSGRLARRGAESDMLAGLGFAMLPAVGLYLGIRLGDLALRGEFTALFAGDLHGTMALLEMALFALAMWMLRDDAHRRRPGHLMRAAIALMLAGSLYRFDVYLLAFDPGAHWSYFPSVAELLITVGLVAGEIAAFIVLVRVFPILAGPPRPGAPQEMPS
jgi:Ni/Fe-hydrogenase subunit HybB-like protein